MLCFTQRTFMDSIKRLWPAYRREQDRRTYEAIRYLVEHPDAPCKIGGVLIHDGYGGSPIECLHFELNNGKGG